jgi:hypothetical protein
MSQQPILAILEKCNDFVVIGRWTKEIPSFPQPYTVIFGGTSLFEWHTKLTPLINVAMLAMIGKTRIMFLSQY